MADHIATPLTRLLDIRTPIISAPMAGIAGGALAAQVSKAGGFGFLGAGSLDTERLAKEFDIARSVLGVSPESGDVLPIGVGFINWLLEEKDDAGQIASDALRFVLKQHVKAILFAFGNDLGSAIDVVRASDAKNESLQKGNKTLIFVQINSVEDAVKAVQDWKVDAIVIQGVEAGGHGSSSALPLLNLVPAVLNEIELGPPIVAAGGLTNGSHLAALLTLGASGIMLGTRFLVSPESTYSDAAKKAVIDAKYGSTIRTMAFDEVRGTMGWPTGIDGRGIRNAVVDDANQELTVNQRMELFNADKLAGKSDRMVVWAGTGVGSVTSAMHAADIVLELHRDAVRSIKATHAFLPK